MSEQKHTPLPWAAQEFLIVSTSKPHPPYLGQPVAHTGCLGLQNHEAIENAKFIALAANTHYQLVAALEAALEAFDTGQRVSNESCGPFGAFKLPETDLQKQIRAALQAAKEQS